MISLLEAIFLGIVQGLTEWLPVSSSGHLVIIQELLRIEAPLLFDVMLHFGTLLAVLVFLREDILAILRELVKKGFNSPSGKLILFLVIGLIPGAIIGFVLHDVIESFFSNLLVVGIGLVVNGTFLFLTRYANGNRTLKLKDSILVGIAQAFSLVPGISRSGSTISTGLIRGISRKVIFKFSFLLSIPAIIGATVFEWGNVAVNQTGVYMFPMLVGTIISAVVGYLSLRFLFRILQRGRFYVFGYYCWAVGVLILLIQFVF